MVVFVPVWLARIVFPKPSYGSNRYLVTIRPLPTAIEVGPTQRIPIDWPDDAECDKNHILAIVEPIFWPHLDLFPRTRQVAA